MSNPIKRTVVTQSSVISSTMMCKKQDRDILRDLVASCSEIRDDPVYCGSGRAHLLDRIYGERHFCSNISESEDILSAFRERRDLIKGLTETIETLRLLTVAFEEAQAYATMQVNAAAMHEGINRLPDEMLAIVMEFAASNVDEAIRLSQVCARFRSVMHFSPRIWAKCGLMVHMTTKQAEVVVLRSKGMPLTARVELNSFGRLNANAILQNTASIGELHTSQINSPILRDYFYGMQLPNVRHISMAWSNYVPTKRTEEPEAHVYETWYLPALRSVKANFVPRPAIGEMIKSCELAFDQSPISVGGLLEFLASCSELEDLRLSFNGTLERKEAMTKQTVNISNLRSLRIETSAKTAPLLLDRVLDSLVCQKLQHLFVTAKEAHGSRGIMRNADTLGNWKERHNAVYRFMRRNETVQSSNVTIELGSV